MIVEPTNLKPRRFRSLLKASDCFVLDPENTRVAGRFDYGIFHLLFETSPARILVGQLDVLDIRHLDDLHLIGVGSNAASGDVVFERLAHAGEGVLKAGAFSLPSHRRRFPDFDGPARAAAVVADLLWRVP